MGKKKVNFFLLLFMLSNIHTYSQELQWQEKNELTKSLYLSLENFVNEELYDKDKAGGYNSFWEFFIRKKTERS